MESDHNMVWLPVLTKKMNDTCMDRWYVSSRFQKQDEI